MNISKTQCGRFRNPNPLSNALSSSTSQLQQEDEVNGVIRLLRKPTAGFA